MIQVKLGVINYSNYLSTTDLTAVLYSCLTPFRLLWPTPGQAVATLLTNYIEDLSNPTLNWANKNIFPKKLIRPTPSSRKK